MLYQKINVVQQNNSELVKKQFLSGSYNYASVDNSFGTIFGKKSIETSSPATF